MNYYTEEAISVIYKLSKKLTGTFEENKEIIDGIMSKYKVSPGASTYDCENDWGDRNANNYVKGLTDIQKIILKTMIKSKNQASLADLVTALTKSGIKNANGNTLSGTLAGLSRKCTSYSVPPIYDYDQKGSYYFITSEALPSITKFLN